VDDDADEVGIQLVKTTDLTVAEELGIKDFPKLVYYQGGLPSVYKGDLSDEGAVLGWMRRIHSISSGIDQEPSRCVLMDLKDEYDASSKSYRCCPPAMDLCAGSRGKSKMGTSTTPSSLVNSIFDKITRVFN